MSPHTGTLAKGILGKPEGRRVMRCVGAYSPEAVSTKSDITLVPYLKANRAAVNTYKYTRYEYTTTV